MNRSTLALSVFVVLLFCTFAHASVLAYDAFDYRDGKIKGCNDGTGWAKGWHGATDSLVTTMDAPLTYTFPTEEVIDGGASALSPDCHSERNNNFDNGIRRRLSQPYSGDVVYASFLFRDDSPSVGKDTCQMWLGSYASLRFGMVVSSEGEGANDFGASLGKDEDGTAITGGDLTLGQTYFIVARISKTIPGAKSTYDQIELWVNPAIDAQDTPDVTASLDQGRISKFSRIGIADTQNRGDTMFVDEVRLGTTWSDMIPGESEPPTPEPVTASVLLVGGLSILWRKRRGGQ